MLEKVLVCLVAGAGAGFGTGLAGLSRSCGNFADADYVSSRKRL